MVNIAYLLILRTGGMEKSCEQWEDMQVGLKTCQAFKDHFAQSYRLYQIRKKATAAAHGYGASANYTQETEAQVNTADALQSLTCAAMEDKEAITKITIINLTLSQSLTQAQENILVLSKQLQALPVHTKQRYHTQREPHYIKKPRMLNRSATAGLMREPADWTIPVQPAISPRQDTK